MSNPKIPTKTPVRARAPAVVAWLGYGGLVPFVLLAALCNLQSAYAQLCASMLLSYSAIILSFVGAQHWALAMTAPNLSAAQRTQGYVWSVVPALLGWVALSIPAAALQLVSTALIAFGFIAQYLQDRRMAQTLALSAWLAWYLPLRARLTVVVSACLALLAKSQLNS